jgi:hypothetical protein
MMIGSLKKLVLIKEDENYQKNIKKWPGTGGIFICHLKITAGDGRL